MANTMPPSSVPGSSPSKAINNAAQTSRDGWNKFGSKDAKEALATDKSIVRKNIDPKTLK